MTTKLCGLLNQDNIDCTVYLLNNLQHHISRLRFSRPPKARLPGDHDSNCLVGVSVCAHGKIRKA